MNPVILFCIPVQFCPFALLFYRLSGKMFVK